MKKFFSLLIMTATVVSLQAQSSGLIDKIKSTNAERTTIEAPFTQVKNMVMMDSKLKSAGTLYFKANDKLAMVYTKPTSDYLVINGDNFMTNAGGKKSVINTKNNPQIKMLRNTLLLCMRCDINAIAKETGGKMSYSENSADHVFTFTTDVQNKAGYNKVVLTIAKGDLSLKELRIDETNGNYTIYTMTSKKFNSTIDDARFSVKK